MLYHAYRNYLYHIDTHTKSVTTHKGIGSKSVTSLAYSWVYKNRWFKVKSLNRSVQEGVTGPVL